MTEQEAKTMLGTMLPMGSRLFVVSRHRTPSAEWFDCFAIVRREGEPDDMARLTHSMTVAGIGTYDHKHEALKVRNPGYRRSLWIEQELQRVLYPTGRLDVPADRVNVVVL